MTAGRARGVVVGTGAATAIGRIRDAMADAEEQDTPLKQKLDQFGAFLSKGIAVICVLVWIVNLPHFNDPLHGSWVGGALYYFKIAVALAVAAIPEGLPAVVTTCLALGTRQMAKRNAIVRRLPSVETLGCTTIICSDKTGTLTTNQMSVVRISTIGNKTGGLQEYKITGTSYAPEGRVLDAAGGEISVPADMPALLQVAACCSLCNDSHLAYNEDRGTYERMGEATEIALRVLSEKIGLPGYQPMAAALATLPKRERATYCNDYWARSQRKVFTLEFSRDRKRMSTLCVDEASGKFTLFCKGAPESVVERCTMCLTNDGSGAVSMTPSMRSGIYQRLADYGGGLALRCLAVAARSWPHNAPRLEITAQDENDLCFLGLVGMQDPPRPEVASAIEECYDAGIRVVMVTGDNRTTAESISRQIRLLKHQQGDTNKQEERPLVERTMSSSMSGQAAADDTVDAVDTAAVMSGIEFEEMDEDMQMAAIERLAVLSRVEPQHKSRLVEILQSQGHIVAMTGDGVNDAPALKRADIGVAMGSGTAVAKHAADMVLADDNFATIVAAVAAGRSIYANTRQFIRYMVSSNIGEVVAIFSAALLGIPECLNPVQLLWVNLVTDGLPATAIGFNKPDGDIMKQPPRKPDEGIVGVWMLVRYLVIGAYVGIATASGFIWWYLSYRDGPRLTWAQLRDFQHCLRNEASDLQTYGIEVEDGVGAVEGLSCDVFASRSPSTVSMSVLVIVEMFNALNAISENGSLLRYPPWSNAWLLGAISLSIILHLIILYVPPLALLFSVTGLSWTEWKTVLWLSAPVVLIDEILKAISRNIIKDDRLSRASRGLRKLRAPSFGLPRLGLISTSGRPRMWHSARMALQRLRGDGPNRDLSRKTSGEMVPIIYHSQ